MAHAVVLKGLVGLLLVVVAHKTHIGVSALHLIHEDLRAEPQKLQVLGQDDRAVHIGEPRDEVGVCGDLFLLGCIRQRSGRRAVFEQKAAAQPVFEVNKLTARLGGRSDQYSGAVPVIAHLPENPVEEPQAVVFRNVCAVFQILGDEGGGEDVGPEKDTAPGVVVDHGGLSEAGPELAGPVDENVGHLGHAIARGELSGDDLLPGGISGDHADRLKRPLLDVQDQVAHDRTEGGGELIEISGGKPHGLLEAQDVRVDIGIEQFGVRIYEAYPEGGETAFFAHAADIEKRLAHFLEHIFGRKLLAFFRDRDDIVVTVIHSIYKRRYLIHENTS